jgi:hypothetical protein
MRVNSELEEALALTHMIMRVNSELKEALD